MEKNLKINVLKAVYFLSTNDASYREISNLNDVLKGFIIDVDKNIKENNLMMNINKENDLSKNKIHSSTSQQINMMKSSRNELILSQNLFLLNNNKNINNNINNINIENKNNKINNNNRILNNNNFTEKLSSDKNEHSSKNRDTTININTNTNNSNQNIDINNTN